MADIDINPFGEHELRPEEPTDENIPLTPGGPRGAPLSRGESTWEPEHEQETSFGGCSAPLHGGTSRTSVLHKEYLVGEIKYTN